MRILVQRVTEAAVDVASRRVGSIGPGLLAYLGVHKDDTGKDAEYLSRKLVNLRVFEDDRGRMNLSALELKVEILIVSQFTLYADTNRGFRPGFSEAMEPAGAEKLYGLFVDLCRRSGLKVETGEFRAMMKVSYTNDGPISLIVDSPQATPKASS